MASDKDGSKYELVYRIQVDDPDEGPFTVRGYAGWSYGDVYAEGLETDAIAICTGISERPIGTSREDWEVTVSFSTQASGKQSTGRLREPSNRSTTD